MRNRFIIALLLVAVAGLPLLAAGTARAQEEVTLSALEIDLWPEYDRPALLVIYRATLAAGASLPAQITFRIPAAAGNPTAVASGPTLSSVADVDYNLQVTGEWAEVSFPATGPAVQFEYYHPGLEKEGTARQFSYTWPGDYAVEALAIQVQQPVDATGMQISPALDEGAAGQDELVYYNKQIGSLAAGEQLTIQVRYEKPDDTLSARNLPVQPGAPIESTGGLATSMRAAVPWILGVLGVFLIAGGGLWYWKSGQRGQAKPPPRRRRRTSSAGEASGAVEGHVYCHNCGKRAGPGDRFCRTCGTKLRIE